MQVEIIESYGDLKREVWNFTLIAGVGGFPYIYLDSYFFQTKESTRHKKWIVQTHWTRIMSRHNNIDKPPLPEAIEEIMRQRFAGQVKELPLIKG